MKLGRRFAVLVLVVAGLVPGVAHAIEVECMNEYGSCTIANNPDSWMCTCHGGSGDETGNSGGDMWADLDEDALTEICVDHLCTPPTTTGWGSEDNSASGATGASGVTSDGGDSGGGGSGGGSTGGGGSGPADGSGGGEGSTASTSSASASGTGTSAGPSTDVDTGQAGGTEGDDATKACACRSNEAASLVPMIPFAFLGLRSRRRSTGGALRQ